MKKRIIIYAITAIISILLLITPAYLCNFRRNFNSLANATLANPTAINYRTFVSYYQSFPAKGYVLVFYTGNQSKFAPNEYITIAKTKKTLQVDLIYGAGTSNTTQLSGADARNFIKEHHIELDTFDIHSKIDEN